MKLYADILEPLDIDVTKDGCFQLKHIENYPFINLPFYICLTIIEPLDVDVTKFNKNYSLLSLNLFDTFSVSYKEDVFFRLDKSQLECQYGYQAEYGRNLYQIRNMMGFELEKIEHMTLYVPVSFDIPKELQSGTDLIKSSEDIKFHFTSSFPGVRMMVLINHVSLV